MRKTLYLENGDLTVKDFKLRFTENLAEYVSQKIQTVLSTIQGEWFLDPTIGIPYFTDIFKKQYDINNITNIFREAILDIDEVDEVVKLELTYTNTDRTLSVNFAVKASDKTIEGTVEV